MWQIVEKVITMVLTVVVTGFIARYLGKEQYGFANYIISLVALFTAFSTLGMERITINDIINKKYEKETILGTSFLLRIIGGILLMIISQITIFILTKGDQMSQILGIIMGFCMLLKATEVIEYYLQAIMKLKVISIIRFITAIVVSGARLLVVFANLGIIGFVATYAVDALIAGILFFIYYKMHNKEKLDASRSYGKDILKRCWYIALSGLMTTIYMRIDQVMLGSMLVNKAENGIYSAGARIAEMWYFVPMAIIAAFQPVIINHRKEKNYEKYKEYMQRLYDIVAIIGIAFGIGISLFGWLAVDILYGSEYAAASNILLISVWAGLFATLGCARSVWLVAENKQKYTLVYTSVGCIINIVLNALLIPKLGAIGAAIATLVTQSVTNVFSLMFFKDTRQSSIMILKAIFINATFFQAIKKVGNKLLKRSN